ncbi:NUDIX hydrolase [Nocardia sp. R16R-3T]
MRAAEVYLVNENRLLLLQRGQSEVLSGLWHVVGGVAEPDEDFRLAAIRETLEECGQEPHLLTPLLTWSHTDTNSKIFVVTTFVAFAVSDRVILSDEHSDYRWSAFDEEFLPALEDISSWSGSQTWLSGAAEARRCFLAWITQDETHARIRK